MADKHKLLIHYTNTFCPKPLSITLIAVDSDKESIAVVRRLFCRNNQENLKIRYIDIYRLEYKPILVHKFVEYEQITGIGWLTKDLLVTVSLEQTINIVSIKTGQRIFSTITDYGSITCSKLSIEHNLLLTGTEYGYVVAYRIDEHRKSIEFVNKMVKINGPINYLDFCVNLKVDRTMTENTIVPNKPIKRKRAATSDGDSDSEEGEELDYADSSENFLSAYDFLIFGASGGDVITWDYHKKTIIDTVHIGEEVNVNVLLVLRKGEVVAGDSSGTVSVLDMNTFTCRYSSNVLPSGITSLAKNSHESSLLVSGQHSSIIIMKRDKSNRDEYCFKEKIESQNCWITSLEFLNKNKFISGSLEGFLTLYKRGKDRCLERNMIGPKHTDKVSYFNGEMMIQNVKSLAICELKRIDRNNSDLSELTNLEPARVLTIKAKNYIQSSVFNDKYIAYSSPIGINVFRRESVDKATMLYSDRSFEKCTCLKIFGIYLIVCRNNDLSVIELDENSQDKATCRVVARHSLKSIIQQVIYIESLQQLLVACGPVKNLIYRLDLSSESSDPFSILDKIKLTERVLFMATDQSEKYVFIYTDSDKILKLKSTHLEGSNVQRKLAGKASVQGLPKDAHILGLIILTKDYAILYDTNAMYKVDINLNEAVNHSSSYSQIVTMCNQVFGDPQDLALAEMSLDDYRAELPSKKQLLGLS